MMRKSDLQFESGSSARVSSIMAGFLAQVPGDLQAVSLKDLTRLNDLCTQTLAKLRKEVWYLSSQQVDDPGGARAAEVQAAKDVARAAVDGAMRVKQAVLQQKMTRLQGD